MKSTEHHGKAFGNFLDAGRGELCVASRRWILITLVFILGAGVQNAGAGNGASPAAGAQHHHQAKQQASAASVPRPDTARFRERVEAALQGARAKNAYWGILVSDRDTGETLYDLNADHFFAPASNAKIFTTALALATLGPEYRFHTTLESKSALESDGRLNGDLLFVGRGDPDLSNRKFPYDEKIERDGKVEKVLAEMADQAVAKGLKEVDGDLVADDSYFPYDPYPAGWSLGDIFFTFGAPVGAIALNDNAVAIEVTPGARAGDPAIILTHPGAALDTITCEITTGQPGAKSDFAVVRQPGLNFLLLRGTISLGHTTIRLDLAMTQPAETTALALKQLLEERGVRVTGGTRVQHATPPYSDAAGEPIFPPSLPPSEPSALILAEHVSPSLLESIRATNKTSQNLHAEILLRVVGREKLGVGSTNAGLKVERDFLRSAGVADGDVILSDGSGLSRDDLVTPRAVVALLRYAQARSWGRDFFSTLPVAGVDGTLEDRMKNTAASGLIEAKTGTTEHVHALSGYATTLRGESLVFSIFANNDARRTPEASVSVDAIAAAMVETLGAAPPATKRK